MTRATFFGIEIGKTGLTLSQLGLDITGHNIANVDTLGYTRQRLISTAYEPNSSLGRALPVNKALVGGGVNVKIHDQIRSAYLDRRFRTENTINSYWQTRTRNLSYLETFFDDYIEETSINYSLATFFGAIKVLAEDTVEGAPRKLLQIAGSDLTKHLNSIYAGLIELQDSQDLAVETTTDKINRMLVDVVELNKAIYRYEITGLVANDLRDKRNLLLDQLSELIDIDYYEYPDGTGMTKMQVWTGNVKLVDHDAWQELGVRKIPNAIEGEDPVWEVYLKGVLAKIDEDRQDFGPWGATLENLENPGVTVGIEVLIGLDRSSPTYTAELNAALDRMDALCNEIRVMDPATQRKEIDEKLAELSGLVRNVSYDEKKGVVLINGVAHDTQAIETRRSDPADAPDILPFAVTRGELKAYLDMRDGADVEIRGIPYYIEMLNNLARALVQEINAIHVTGWTDNPPLSESGIVFFDADGAVHDIVKDADGNVISYNITNIHDITAKNIRLNEYIAAEGGEYNIACSTVKIDKNLPTGLQSGNNENMNKLYEVFLRKDITVAGTTIGSYDGFATGIRFDLATTLNFAKSTAENSTILTISAENQRQSISGVSLDEEMTNLIKYQHAYNGASRVITTMDDALDVLINRTGRVGL